MALVAALMLVLAALRTALMATPFSGGSTWGGYSFWELRHSLPQGVFSAALLLICSAAFSLSLQAAANLALKKDICINSFLHVATACLWCGIPVLACCRLCMHLIFPPEMTCIPSELPFWVLGTISFILMLCLPAAQLRHKVFSWLVLPASVLSLLTCGELQSQSLTMLPGCIFLSAGMALLQAGYRLPVSAGICILGAGMHAILTGPGLSGGFVYAVTLLCLSPALYLRLTARQD